MKKWIFVFAIIIFLASADARNDLHDKSIHEKPDLSASDMEKNIWLGLEEAEKLLYEKCANKSVDSMMAKEEIQFCVENQLQEQKKSWLSGGIVTEFRLYCRKLPQWKSCISNYTSAIKSCMDDKEKEGMRIIESIVDAALRFICFEAVDQITLVMADDDPECPKDKNDVIISCKYSLVSKYLPNVGENVNVTDMPIFKLEENECRDISKFQNCIVAEFKRCKDTRVANIIDSLFNFVREETPCAKYPHDPNSAFLFTGNMFYILSIFVLHTLLSLVYKF